MSRDLPFTDMGFNKDHPSDYTSPLKNFIYSSKALGLDDVHMRSIVTIRKQNGPQLNDLTSKELDDFLRDDLK